MRVMSAWCAALVLAAAACESPGGGLGGDDARATDARISDGALLDAASGDAAPDALVDAGVDGATDAPPPPPIDAPPPPPIDAPPPPPIDAPPPPIDAPPPPPPPPAHVLYPAGQRHAPITPAIVDRLSAIASTPRTAQNFLKAGDSITRAPEFLRCFDGGSVDLGAYASLSSTIAYYLGGSVGGVSPFKRDSVAAFGGATAADVLAGSPSKVAQELDVSSARVGITMLGTNDLRTGRTLDAFIVDLWTILDAQLADGTIPILSSIPANLSDPFSMAAVPRWNLAIRGLAQGLQLPFMDLNHALAPLPNQGMSSDGIHPSVAPGGACLLTSAGLQYGYNMRNLLTVEALARVRSALGGTASESSAATLTGQGTLASPYVAPWPFADASDTRTAAGVAHACGSAAGGALVYQLQVPSAMQLQAQVIDRGGTNVDVHVIQNGACRGTGDASVTASVAAGTITVVVSSPSPATEGAFLVVIGPR